MISKTLVWAHRGASAYEPENTVEAFALAAKMKADGVELDVQLSKDGEVVVIHDETIDRVSGEHGYVKDFTLAKLKELNVSAFRKDIDHITRIPTLREVFACLKDTPLTINVELKTGIIRYPGIEEKVRKLIEEFALEDRIWISSFNHESVLKFRSLCPTVKCGFLFEDVMLNPEVYAHNYGVEALHPATYHYFEMDHDYIRKAKEQGLETHIWTVNDQSEMKALCEVGCEAIITNYPDIAREIVDSKYSME